MREMKDSGVEWIGEVPVDWDINQAGQHLIEVKSKNTDMRETNLLSLSYGNIKRRDIKSNEGLLPESFEGYNVIESGDIVLRFTDLQNDQKSLRVGRSTERGIVTSAYTTVRPRNDTESRYLSYVLHSFDAMKGFYGMGSGVRQGLKWQEAKYIRVPWPSLDEQRRIADYLDARCADIDTAVDAAEKSIDEYEFLRRNLVSQAVTRGIGGQAKLGHVFVPFVGRIPEGWSKAKLIHLLNAFIDCPHETPTYSATGFYRVIRAGNQTLGGLNDEKMLHLDEAEYRKRTRRSALLKNDIVYGREGNWGIASLVSESDKYCLGQRMMQFRCNEQRFLPQFAVFALNGNYIKEQGRQDEVGSTSHHVNVATIANYCIALPPISVQRHIASYLHECMEYIDSVVDTKQSIISDLKTYKQSLIYEVVTGKRKVY